MSKRNVSGQPNINIDPFRFMELDKPDILYKLTIELGYSEEEALREFHSMLAMLTLLKSMRHCQSQTDDWLKDAVPQLHPRVKMLTVTILLDAMKDDDTYCHAYNTFVYYACRYLRMHRPRKIITDHKLLILLEDEKKQAEHPVNGKDQLKLSQIALKHVWEGQSISLENCRQIAREYGYSSGKALYNKYCTWASAAFRKAVSDLSRKQLKNKIELFKSVVDLLPESKKNHAQEELNILCRKLEEEF
jgi:hypothetical protein